VQSGPYLILGANTRYRQYHRPIDFRLRLWRNPSFAWADTALGLYQIFKERMAKHARSNLETSRETRTADDAERLTDSVYAFPKQRKEPLTDAQHVRNAVARFDQVTDVSDADRALAFANIEKAAKYYDINLGGNIMARPEHSSSKE
jgi:hypothetical protein